MSGIDALIAQPWGSALAIAGMMVVTYLCRIAGVVLMSRVRITPRIERGLRALPGSVIVATILPAALDSGWPALLSLGATIAVMAFTRIDILSLAVGLGTLSVIRALL